MHVRVGKSGSKFFWLSARVVGINICACEEAVFHTLICKRALFNTISTSLIPRKTEMFH